MKRTPAQFIEDLLRRVDQWQDVKKCWNYIRKRNIQIIESPTVNTGIE